MHAYRPTSNHGSNLNRAGWPQRYATSCRVGVFSGPAPRRFHVNPDRSDGAKVRYMVEAGVVGRISKCSSGWCRIEIGKRQGYIRESDLWGVAENEVVD